MHRPWRAARCALGVPLLVGLVACNGSGDDAAPSEESWCEVVAASNALDDEFDSIEGAGATELKAVLDKIALLGPRFTAAAPAEIDEQVEVYAETNGKLVDVFAAADYVVADIDEAQLEVVLAEIDGIDTEIDVYTIAECGEPLGPDDS